MTNKRKYLALDLEIATPIPPGATWDDYRPFGIACAATWASDMSVPILWAEGATPPTMFRNSMGPMRLADLVFYLFNAAGAGGYTIVTFNGAGFDFSVLAEESSEHTICKRLARDHVDLFFHIFAAKGYSKGLDTIARGMELQGKPEGVDGAKAPQLWLDGRYHEVLDYCARDCKMTLDIAHLGEQYGNVRWVARNGDLDGVDLPDGWLTVAEAIQLPEPDTSWMTDPWSRDKFVGWMK